MIATVGSIHEAAQALLDTAEEALQATSAGFDGPTWLNPGMPAFDVGCDFITVWMGGENLAPSVIPASQTFRVNQRINLVTLNVTTGRCLTTSVGTRPLTIAQKTADAVKHMEDGQALWNGVGDAIAAGLFDGTCKQISVQGMTAYTPQGGLAGFNLALLVQVDGYPVAG